MISLKKWLWSFWLVLIKPIPNTFILITQDVKGSFGGSIAWITFIIVIIFLPTSLIYDDPRFIELMIIAVFLVPVWILIFVFLLHRLNQLLFKNDLFCYEELLYGIVVIFVVISLFDILFILFQVSQSILIFTTIIYRLVLITICVKSIMKINYWKSLLNILISFPLSLVVFLLIVSFFMLLIQDIPRFF